MGNLHRNKNTTNEEAQRSQGESKVGNSQLKIRASKVVVMKVNVVTA